MKDAAARLVGLEDDRFTSLYEKHFECIYAYVVRRADPSEVNDLVQEVFAAAWRSAAHIPEPPEDRLWLYGVARRAVSRSRWGLARRRRLQERLASMPAPRPCPAELPDLLAAELLEAMDHLRSRDREVLQLVIWDDLSRPEVARLLGCSVNAVDIRFHRATKRLRSRLASTEACRLPDFRVPLTK